MSRQTVRLTYQEVETQAIELTDRICDLLPGLSRLAVALAIISLSRQIEAGSTKEWEAAKRILSEEVTR